MSASNNRLLRDTSTLFVLLLILLATAQCGGSGGGNNIGGQDVAGGDADGATDLAGADGFDLSETVEPQCTQASDCTDAIGECQVHACVDSVCSVEDAPKGTVVETQTPGDCLANQCDGAGGVESVPDDSDLPDDSNPCTEELCSNGEPTSQNKEAGTECGEDLVCDGEGTCVGCTTPEECGADELCLTRTCDQHTCGILYVAGGTSVPDPLDGDCKLAKCDGLGSIMELPDNTDTPADDGNPCTKEICTGSEPGHTNQPDGTACEQDGGHVCVSGECRECREAGDCGGVTECATPTCIDYSCSMQNLAEGTPLLLQADGDCLKRQCDGNGGVGTVYDDSDIEDDSNDCTQDFCSSGQSIHSPQPAGYSCGDGGLCDGNGTCIECLEASDCGTDSVCVTFTCDQGMCGSIYAPQGTAVQDTIIGNCNKLICDGNGNTIGAIDSQDLPPDDGNQCTTEVCKNGMPDHPPTNEGTECNQNGGSMCDGQANCVECLSAADCPSSTLCAKAVCTLGHCGFEYSVEVLYDPTDGDCQGLRCNGSGGTESFPDDTDLHVDGNECTDDLCTGGVVSNPPVTDGVVCSTGGTCVSGVCNAPKCGDGVPNGTDECDDGNSVNGDGCDNNCTVTACGNGIITQLEECDDGRLPSGDGCSQQCLVELGYTCTGTPSLCLFTCGNGVLDANEECDDGANSPYDGCGALCLLEPTAETESNDTCASANGPYTVPATPGGRLHSGSISSVSDMDWYLFSVPVYADLSFETFDSSGPGSCTPSLVDTSLMLFKSDCITAVGYIQDQGGIGNCSLLDANTQPASMRHLAPGVYALRVKAGSTGISFNYTLQVKYLALCGNGVVEGSEACDGGAACQADCTLAPGCGDGVRQSYEQCDDGGQAAGDGCSAGCNWEVVPEVEPNDAVANADSNAISNINLLINGNRNITGSLSVAGDKDIYKIAIPLSGAIVHFEVFDSDGNDCRTAAPYSMSANNLRLLNSAGTVLVSDTTGSGIGDCAALTYRFTPGTYYIQVDKSSGTLANYFLRVVFHTDGGSETEPNDTQATATPAAGFTPNIFGKHPVSTDKDYYVIDVPQGRSLRVEIVEGDESETCEGSGMDSYLTVYNVTGTVLATNDDSGRGFCSLLDGTGSAPASAALHGLAAGTYYIAVTSSTLASGADAQFNYRVAILIGD